MSDFDPKTAGPDRKLILPPRSDNPSHEDYRPTVEQKYRETARSFRRGKVDSGYDIYSPEQNRKIATIFSLMLIFGIPLTIGLCIYFGISLGR